MAMTLAFWRRKEEDLDVQLRRRPRAGKPYWIAFAFVVVTGGIYTHLGLKYQRLPPPAPLAVLAADAAALSPEQFQKVRELLADEEGVKKLRAKVEEFSAKGE